MGQLLSTIDSQSPDLSSLAQLNDKGSELLTTEEADIDLFLPLKPTENTHMNTE
ncbi:unnamed protein product, partial [Didymodactylos carnosus]